MIIVKLMGGLGNQMFQYAAGRRLARANNTDLKLDVSWFSEASAVAASREYALQVFSAVQNIASMDDKTRLKNSLKNKLSVFLKRYLHIMSPLCLQTHIHEKQFHFDPDILHLCGEFYIEGYWQTEKYFKDISGFLISSFRFPPFKDDENKKFADKILNAQNAVFIQVRRGDYLAIADTDKIMCSVEYYKKGAEYIAQRVENPQFFVFSAEDPDWAIKNLNIGFPFEIIGAENTGKEKYYENMHLMSLCRHAVLANSSYSWWGAWLNQNSNKIIVAPDPWFSTDSDIYCDSWVKISRE